ncbi:hypothetical protein [Pseudactinotalea sp. Z1748]|uniref:hypothetical protein n=1 Tax=Pseudactinotalea sp. Z1748 TaxID=3413027 RepID=UPI003C79EB8C
MTATVFPAQVTAGRPCLQGTRTRQQVVADLLDTRGRYLRPLGKVRSGNVEYSIHNAIRSSGSIEVDDPGAIDWHRHRIRLRYLYVCEQGHDHDEALGEFLPTSPGTDFDQFGASGAGDLYDKMALLAQEEIAETWTFDKGTTIVAAVTEVLESVGETRIAAPEDGGGELQNPMVFEPGTTKLQVINGTEDRRGLLDAGNFFSIWVDRDGTWRIDRYIPPDQRGVEHVFESGENNTIFGAEYSHDADDWQVPNRVILVGKPETDADGEELPAPHAVAENNNPDDPYSIPGRGRVITHTEHDQDATSVDVLGQIAARRLLELSAVTSTYQIAHDWLPLDLNAAVRLRVPEHSIDALCVLQSYTWSWDAASDTGVDLVNATLREVKQ